MWTVHRVIGHHIACLGPMDFILGLRYHIVACELPQASSLVAERDCFSWHDVALQEHAT